jgi:hypothetical protein
MVIKVSIKLRLIVIFHIILASYSFGQEAFLDPADKYLLDSLESRIKNLEQIISGLSANRDVNFYYTKRDLDITVFLSQYYHSIADENIDEAKEVIDLHLQAAEKRRDEYSIKFYKDYQSRLTTEIQKQWRHYQFLFQKEKNFENEFNKFYKVRDEYSLNRCKRMTSLAIKYARERKLDITLKYLFKYDRMVNAALISYHSEFDLDKLTRKESEFQKVFSLLISSDSLEQIKKAGLLVENCYSYVENISCALDTNYFIKQQIIVTNALYDYNQRKGNNSELSLLIGKTIKGRFDTLNREGIYKWNDYILVIGEFDPKAKFDNVKKGEAISDADHRLLEYIRINRLANLGNKVKMGTTYLIPFFNDNKQQDFKYIPELRKFQYMVCYTQIENVDLTKQICRLLPPIEFEVIDKLP